MQKQNGRRWIGVAAAAAIAWGATGAGAEDEVLGRVHSVTGHATGQRPGEDPRALACGDAVYADDTLRTAADARVGVLLDDMATHLAPDTTVSLGRTEQATPAARLEMGQVRVIDPREGGEPARLAVLDADADVVGNDAEAYLFREKVGPYAMLCEWDAPLPVNRGPEALAADPGECVISKPKEPLYHANAHDERLPIDAAEACEPELAHLSSPLHHLSPQDVAAGPPPPAATLTIPDVVAPVRSPCDFAVGACAELPRP